MIPWCRWHTHTHTHAHTRTHAHTQAWRDAHTRTSLEELGRAWAGVCGRVWAGQSTTCGAGVSAWGDPIPAHLRSDTSTLATDQITAGFCPHSSLPKLHRCLQGTMLSHLHAITRYRVVIRARPFDDIGQTAPPTLQHPRTRARHTFATPNRSTRREKASFLAPVARKAIL